MRKLTLVVAGAAIMIFAASGVGHAQIGVGVMWEGDGITPDMVLPIMAGEGLVIEPTLGLTRIERDDGSMPSHLLSMLEEFEAGEDPAFTQIRFGLNVEKHMTPGGTTALFGGNIAVIMNSPSDLFADEEWDDDLEDYVLVGEVQSWMDIELGVFVGGSASLADGVDIVGTWGPTISLLGKIEAEEEGQKAEMVESATHFSSRGAENPLLALGYLIPPLRNGLNYPPGIPAGRVFLMAATRKQARGKAARPT